MRTRICVVLACLAAAACGGDNPIAPPPPPPPAAESVTAVTITAPTTDSIVGTNTSVTLSATAETANGTAAPSYIWQIDGTTVGSGQSVAAELKPGAHSLCVTASASNSLQGCKSLTFVPHLTCKVVAAHPTSTALEAPLVVTFSRHDTTETKQVGLDGDCSLNTPLALGIDADTVRIVLDAPSGSDRVYHPMIAYASKADEVSGITLITIPRKYQIQDGDFKGMTIDIDLDLAYTAGSDKSSFYQRGIVPRAGGRYFYEDAAFSSTDLPQPVKILTQPQVFSSTSVDSITIQLAKANRVFGITYTQTPAVKDTAYWAKGAMMVTLDSTACGGDIILACAGNDITFGGGDLDGGSITYKKESSVVSTVTIHEFVHFLGFGHGCGWHGIMNQWCSWDTGTFPYAGPTDSLTAPDVGYTKLYYRVRDLERTFNTWFSLGPSHQGEEVLMKNQKEQLITRIHY